MRMSDDREETRVDPAVEPAGAEVARGERVADLPPGPGGGSRVRDIMVGDVVTVRPDDSCHLAAVRMRTHNVGLLPVVRDGKVLGVVTDRDLVLRFVAEGGSPPEDVPVSACMSDGVVSVTGDVSVTEALRTMQAHSVRRLLVIEGNVLVGVLALDDVLLRLGRTEEVGRLIDELYVQAMARDWV